MIDLETVLRREHPVAHPLKDVDQLAVFDAAQSEIVVLNALGAAIWEMLDGEISLAEIAQEIAENVPEAPEPPLVQAEVLRFAETLLSRRAVSVVEA